MQIQHMDSKQCADYIGVHVNTLRKYVHEENLPVLKFPGRRKWVFRKDLVDNWIYRKSMPEVVNDPSEGQIQKEYGKLRILSP